MKNIKYYIVLLLLLISLKSEAQLKSVEMNVSGLTCSMCSFATEKALRTLDFVQDVNTDLNTNTFIITFKEGKKVSFDQIKRKVEGAGFSVFIFKTVYDFKNQEVKNGYTLDAGGSELEFINTKKQSLNGDVKLTVLDKGFVSAEAYKKMLKDANYKELARQENAQEQIYHVSL